LFGKHKGAEVGDLDSDYLFWVAGQAFVRFKYPELYRELIIEIDERALNGCLADDL
jgi:uncharacterized protein (DUF3820 family)